MCPYPTEKDLAARTNDDLVKTVRDTAAASDRRWAFQELAHRDGPELSEVARQACDDRRAPSELRRAAAVVLGERVDSESEKSLARALSSEDAGLARLAATSLGKIGDESTLVPLREADGSTSPPVRRATSFARSLISYRLGLPGERLRRPAARAMATLDATRAETVRVNEVPRRAIAEAADDLEVELPRLAIATSESIRLSCQGEQLWVVLSEKAMQEGSRALTDRSSVPAVVLKLATCPERWYVHEYVMTHPGAGGSILAFGVRPSGHMNHFGEVRIDGDDAMLSLQALNVAGVSALSLQIGYSGTRGDLAVREARTSFSTRDDARSRLVVKPVRGVA